MSAAPSPPRSDFWPFVQPIAIAIAVLGLGTALDQVRRDEPPAEPTPSASAPVVTQPPINQPDPISPAPISPPVEDLASRRTAALADAEAELDAVSRDRARAEDRRLANDLSAERQQIQLVQAVRSTRSAGLRLVQMQRRVQDLESRLPALREQVSSLAAQVDQMDAIPLPQRPNLLEATPVAQVVDGSEYHFEVRANRVSFIDLDRLIARVKADAGLQIRMSGSQLGNRAISATVGPIGDFTLYYELVRSLPSNLSEALDGAGQLSYSLAGWEIRPIRENRGESWEQLHDPASPVRRVLNTLDPRSATITLWIYPDSFKLYRPLAAFLHDAGFVVAARPMPDAMPIRGSPGGSMSAGQ